VFFTHARESIGYHYERNPVDPRINHALTLEVDDFGNVLKSAAIGYGRREWITLLDDEGNAVCDDEKNVTEVPNPGLSDLDHEVDQEKQTQIHITLTENCFTKDHGTGDDAIDGRDDYRTPLPCESRTYELTGLTLPEGTERFTFDTVQDAATMAIPRDYEHDATGELLEKRLIEHVRTYYRRNHLDGRLPLGELQSLALPFESYKLAFTAVLASETFVDSGRMSQSDLDSALADDGKYVHSEGDTSWWIPSGLIFYSPEPDDEPAQEEAYARQHFFLPHRYRDPFHTELVSTESFVTYDTYDLLVQETRDALENRVTVGERNVDPTQPLMRFHQDYRVLQPALVMDPNRNRSEVAFDALGMVVAIAVMGKPAPAPVEGDSLSEFHADITHADLTQSEIDQFLADPKGTIATDLLGNATSRIV
jgi:hypothetical protein